MVKEQFLDSSIVCMSYCGRRNEIGVEKLKKASLIKSFSMRIGELASFSVIDPLGLKSHLLMIT